MKLIQLLKVNFGLQYEVLKTICRLTYEIKLTSGVVHEEYTTNNHEVGFIINCSFGNGLRISGEANSPGLLR